MVLQKISSKRWPDASEFGGRFERYVQFFQNEGLSPTPAPTNHLANIKYPNFSEFFSVLALKKATIVWHETLGLIWQKVKGI